MRLKGNPNAGKSNEDYRTAVRLIAGKINSRVQNVEYLKIKATDIFENAGYLSTSQAAHVKSNPEYVLGRVMRRLRNHHNLCVVPVTEKLFSYSMPEILEFTPEEAKSFVSTGPGIPTIGMYVSMSKDGSLFAAYENTQHHGQIISRVKASVKRIDTELGAKRLSKPAKEAVLSSAKELAHEVNLSANAMQRKLFP